MSKIDDVSPRDVLAIDNLLKLGALTNLLIDKAKLFSREDLETEMASLSKKFSEEMTKTLKEEAIKPADIKE